MLHWYMEMMTVYDDSIDELCWWTDFMVFASMMFVMMMIFMLVSMTDFLKLLMDYESRIVMMLTAVDMFGNNGCNIAGYSSEALASEIS